MSRPIICFIDDSPFEHQMVREEIAPVAPDMEFLQCETFGQTCQALGERRPTLFLLDLWGPDATRLAPQLPSHEELRTRAAAFPSLEGVTAGLDSFQGEPVNEYLKRLFVIVDSWRTLFETVCDRVGQNRKYGLGNLAAARCTYPGVPAVFYTRKALIRDAVAVIRAGVDGLFIKPSGADDRETRLRTREYAPHLLQELRKIIDVASSGQNQSGE